MGNNSMGHAWLLAELTMRMEQHKVQRIVSRVQVIDPPYTAAACTHSDVPACNTLVTTACAGGATFMSMNEEHCIK
jgi:hypothetical protein